MVGMSADVSKMFREVELHKDDRDMHRFLQSSTRGEDIMDMRMTRVTFGVTSSPFLATQVLRQVAKDHKNQYPRAAKISSNFYVDDCLTGVASPEEAIEIQELIALLRCAAAFKVLHCLLDNTQWSCPHPKFYVIAITDIICVEEQ